MLLNHTCVTLTLKVTLCTYFAMCCDIHKVSLVPLLCTLHFCWLDILYISTKSLNHHYIWEHRGALL